MKRISQTRYHLQNKEQFIRAIGNFFFGSRLSKNVGHHGWPITKNYKITLAKTALKQSQKRNLDQKINASKPHIWSLSINRNLDEAYLYPSPPAGFPLITQKR